MPERELLVTVLIKPDGTGSLLTLIQSSSSTRPRATVTAKAGQAASTSSSIISRNQGGHHGTGRSQEAQRNRRSRNAKLPRELRLERVDDERDRGAQRFYRDTIGWSFEPMKMDWGTYWIAKSGDKNVGGMFELTQP